MQVVALGPLVVDVRSVDDLLQTSCQFEEQSLKDWLVARDDVRLNAWLSLIFHT